MTQTSLALPTGRDENWRYAALRPVTQLNWGEPSPEWTTDVEAQVTALLPPRLADSRRLVLFAGRVVPALSDGITIGSSRGKLADALTLECLENEAPSGPSTLDIDQRFADLNRQHATQTLRLTLSTQGDAHPIEIIHIASGVSHPAIELVLPAEASAQIIERQLSRGEIASATNLRLDIHLGSRAKLHLARLLQCGTQAQHIETLNIGLADGAELDYTQISLSAGNARSTALIEHANESQVNWQASALAAGRQVFDHYVLTRHAQRGARTQQTFRGIASEQSRLAFNGHMQVTKSGLQSDLQQSLKCLLDGTRAEANVRPQLEIYTDVVSASHGATVGKLDRDMLFYLLSRGIDPMTAESLLKWAFISDVLTKLPMGLREQIELALLDRLPGAIASPAANAPTHESQR